MNLIPKIVEMLGVEIGEEFKMKSDEGEYDEIYRFDENAALQMKNRCGWGISCRLPALLAGDIEIIKLPFEPKEGNPYWVATWDPNENTLTTCKVPWHNRADCWADKYCGNVFRTEKEAETHKYEIYEKLTGKKWGGE